MKKINIGDWVTQYRTGYWKVKELHPKYSPFDCDRLHKGEPIGVEAVLQKAFNNTFKFNMEMSTCDLSLCQHVTKAVMRKIEKYFKEVCLLDQPFIKDGDKTINDVVLEATVKMGEKVSIRRFTRYQLGEGIEKKQENFADEVMSQIKG